MKDFQPNRLAVLSSARVTFDLTQSHTLQALDVFMQDLDPTSHAFDQ